MEEMIEISQTDFDAFDPKNINDPHSIFYRALEILPKVLDSTIGLLE
jgi:hypothetical protein